MLTPIEMMIDAACLTCTRCEKGRDACRCYEACWCGTVRLRAVAACPNYEEHQYTPQRTCACSLPAVSRRACADARQNKTACRCNCHAADVAALYRTQQPKTERE